MVQVDVGRGDRGVPEPLPAFGCVSATGSARRRVRSVVPVTLPHGASASRAGWRPHVGANMPSWSGRTRAALRVLAKRRQRTSRSARRAARSCSRLRESGPSGCPPRCPGGICGGDWSARSAGSAPAPKRNPALPWSQERQLTGLGDRPAATPWRTRSGPRRQEIVRRPASGRQGRGALERSRTRRKSSRERRPHCLEAMIVCRGAPFTAQRLDDEQPASAGVRYVRRGDDWERGGSIL